MRHLAAMPLLVLLLTGCQSGDARPTAPLITGPLIVIPPGVRSDQTAAQAVQKTLSAIADNEAMIGRALAPIRIIKIQLVREGDTVMLDNLDGTNSSTGLGPDGGPGWVVEAVGTFVYRDWRHGNRISDLATHGLYLWGDAGDTGTAFTPCWTVPPVPAAFVFDGKCGPP